MVSYCCVKGCSNNSNHKKKDPGAMISFHAFPCNQELKTKWLRAIGRPNWSPPSHARICSIHFNHDQINYEGCRIRIKDDAIPVNNLPPNSNFEASNVEACRICLATELKLYSLQDSQLSTCMDSITGFNENYNIEGLPQYVCYLCAARLIKCYKLVEKSMIAQATLLDIFAAHGQITKSLIQLQNREKLNLKSSLYCCTPKNYYNYKYNEENNMSNNINSIHNTNSDIYFKNENTQQEKELSFEIKPDTDDETKKYEMEMKENEINEDVNYDSDHLNESPMEIAGNNFESDNNIGEDDKKNIDCGNIKRKRLKSKEKTFRKRPARRKDTGLTPDETEMQKYFDIVKLSLQEQIEEWKRNIVRRPLTSETIYECEICSKIFAHINTYRVHIGSHDPSRGKVECPICKLRFKNDVLARSHANKHAKKFYCKTCPKVFNNVGVAKKHQLWHSGYTYKCSQCSFSSAHASSLNTHARAAHARSHVCDECGRAAVSRRGLMLHKATAHRNVKDTIVTKAYRCEACNINFVSEGARRVHLLTSRQHRKKTDLCDPTPQSIELRNSCNKCGVECSSLSELVAHTRAEHPRPNRKHWRSQYSYPTQCELCGDTMSCRRKHWHHVRRQHPKETAIYRPVVTAVCDTCGKGFQNSTKLHLHQLRHSAPSVPCESCPRLFYDKYALARHKTTHNTTKPHQCRTCGRAFKLRNNLARHLRVHTDVATYECTMCNKKFKHSSSVNLHIRTVHYKLPHPPRKKRNKLNRDSNVANDM